MSKKRRTFTTELKSEAASPVLDKRYGISEASRSLGIGETALRGWVAQLEGELGGATPKSRALTPEQQRIQELEK
jgi:transposase